MDFKIYRLAIVLIFCTLIINACGGGGAATEVPIESQTDPCGNDVCDEAETASTCPADCPAEVIPQPTPTEDIDPQGFITFVVKVSDFVHLNDSAETLLQLIDIFEAQGVRAEFYLTGPMLRLFAQQHLELVQRFSDSRMTISYHVQPPHPFVPGFQAPLQGLPVNVTEDTIREYESAALDLTTGSLQEVNPGGYGYLTEVFGNPPVTVSIPDTSMRGFALPIFQQLGAKMVVLKEGERSDPDQPYHQEYGMWVRPADIHISHWPTVGIDASMAWWDMLATESAASYQPVSRLQEELVSWGDERLPFVVVSIDAYNFYREGPPPWTMIYYQAPGSTQPNSPPYDLEAPDLTSPRSPENQIAVWEAYSAMVEWAAKYMQVVTGDDIVNMATMAE